MAMGLIGPIRLICLMGKAWLSRSQTTPAPDFEGGVGLQKFC
jgi:hypothetical protein